MSARNKSGSHRWWQIWQKSGAVGTLLTAFGIMRTVRPGDVIADQYGNRLRVSEVIHNPRYDIDGVPVSVKGYSVEDGVHCAISFGRVGPGQPIEDWRKWRVVALA